MAENENVELENDLPDAEVTTLTGIDPATATPEQVAQLVKAVKTTTAQKAHWRNKAIDPATGKPYRDIVRATTTPPPTVTPPTQTQAPETAALAQDIAALKTAEEKRQFGSKHGLSAEETDKAFAFAQGLGKKPEDVLQDPFFKNGLEATRRAGSVSRATMQPSRRQPSVAGKSFKDMSETERRDNFSKFTGAAQ